MPVQMNAQEVNKDKETKPLILYSGAPQKYEIGGIRVTGGDNYEDYVLIGLSGLSVGQTISVPGDEVTQAIKRYWNNGLFSQVKIEADSIVDNKIFLNIALVQRPRISDIVYHGVKKSEREDLEASLGIMKGGQVTPNIIDRAKVLAKRYFDDKGFKNAEIVINQHDDPNKTNQVIVDINIDKKEKVKIHQITIEGNVALSEKKIKRTMKKTNEKGKLVNLFKTKKFIEDNYEADKENIINKYNELGYRDAVILWDSVSNYDDRTVDIHIKIDEGQKYYLRNISWVGNTVYPTDYLNAVLGMKHGDVYNQKMLKERTTDDEDAIGNLYYNNGYVFFNLDPVEVNVDNDSIDLEMRIVEGPQASINGCVSRATTACMKTSCAVNFVHVRATYSVKRTWNVPIVSWPKWGTSTRKPSIRRWNPTMRTERSTSTTSWSPRPTTRLNFRPDGDRPVSSVS